MRTDCAGGCVIAGRETRGVAVIGFVFAVFASVVVWVGAARAEDSNEVSIGTFKLGPSHDGFSIIEPPAGVPERQRDGADDGSGRWFFQGWQSSPRQEPSADDLYKDALRALEGGQRAEAQRLFERLIAEAPSSTRASAARQYLGEIYRNTAAERALPWTQANDTAAAAVPASIAISQAPPRATVHQARVSAAIDGRFLSDAGDRVFFSAGSASLGSRAQGVIQAQARFLIRHPHLFAAVEGHSDDGALADAETLRLSEERAAVVRQRLVAEGVAPQRLLAYGRGREERVSDCLAPECLAQNRRAVTVLLSRRVAPEASPLRRAEGGAQGPASRGLPTQ